MANEYGTVFALKETLSLQGVSFADADLTVALEAASRAIDELTNRRFWKDSAEATRYFDPEDWETCLLDDVVDVTTFKVDYDGDGTFEQIWALNTDYVLEPLNADKDDRPFVWAVRHPRGRYRFPTSYPRTVEVTGIFGWPEIPPPITSATSILAVQLVRRMREAPFGVVALGLDGAAVRIARSDPHIGLLVGPFCRGTGYVV